MMMGGAVTIRAGNERNRQFVVLPTQLNFWSTSFGITATRPRSHHIITLDDFSHSTYRIFTKQ